LATEESDAWRVNPREQLALFFIDAACCITPTDRSNANDTDTAVTRANADRTENGSA
jgi:hypothetical protein